MHELDAIQNARIRRLVGHFKLDLILFEVATALRIDLREGLQEDEAAEALESEPLSALEVDIELLTCLVELSRVNLFARENWQLRNGIELRHGI